MITEQELNKRLAEWRFPNTKILILGKHIRMWGADALSEIEWLTQSLDACFRWLVPNHDITCIMFIYTDDDVICKIEIALSKEYEGLADIEKPALALCLAIEKLIDSGVKGGD